MDFLFDNDRPIYVQLLETLRIGVISGEYPPGARLPSGRELSMLAKVNPNTMQRALSQLEEDGLIYTERTNGKFVTTDEARIAAVKTALAEETARRFLAQMERIGCKKETALEILHSIGGK